MYKRFEILLFSASFTGKKAAPEIADVSNSDIFPNGSQFSSLRLLRWFFFTFQLIEKNGGKKLLPIQGLFRFRRMVEKCQLFSFCWHRHCRHRHCDVEIHLNRFSFLDIFLACLHVNATVGIVYFSLHYFSYFVSDSLIDT